MKSIKQIFLALIMGGYFFMLFPLHVNAFLGEDLGLELYKNIDEGFGELERKQYEYEMKGQGETSINEVVNPILAEDGVQCDINSTQDIERLLGNYGGNQVADIVEKCSADGNPVPTALVEQVVNSLSRVKNDFYQRAGDKARRSYELARIGLYSDGNLENGPFDLIYDLQEIDKIIFGEELEYNGVPYENADEALDDFLQEDKDYLYEDEDEAKDETGSGSVDDETGTGSTDDLPITLVPDIGDHRYMCLPGDGPGLSDDELDDIISDIEGGTGSTYTPVTHVWSYPDTTVSNGASWGGPFPAIGPSDSYSDVRDSWKCGKFFCIIIEFQKSNYGLAGGETMSIQKILSKAAEHLEKPANASLTQRKMTTNNFELGSIIKDLPGMLRGFGIEVQSKPVPILDLETENESLLGDDTDGIEDMVARYYKNIGLDYERRNDLDIFNNSGEESKILQTSAGMPITYVEQRNNELKKFQAALRENNRILSQAVDSQILTDDLKDFGDQFTELEKFVDAMEDFVKSIKGVIGEMKEIKTRSS